MRNRRNLIAIDKKLNPRRLVAFFRVIRIRIRSEFMIISCIYVNEWIYGRENLKTCTLRKLRFSSNIIMVEFLFCHLLRDTRWLLFSLVSYRIIGTVVHHRNYNIELLTWLKYLRLLLLCLFCFISFFFLFFFFLLLFVIFRNYILHFASSSPSGEGARWKWKHERK